MQDTLQCYPIKNALTGGADGDFDVANVRIFPRIASDDSKTAIRRHRDSNGRNAISLRIAHQTRKGSESVRHTLCALDHEIDRVDSSTGSVASTDRLSVKLQCDIPSGVSLQEFRDAVNLLIGVLKDTGAGNDIVASLFNSEL